MTGSRQAPSQAQHDWIWDRFGVDMTSHGGAKVQPAPTAGTDAETPDATGRELIGLTRSASGSTQADANVDAMLAGMARAHAERRTGTQVASAGPNTVTDASGAPPHGAQSVWGRMADAMPTWQQVKGVGQVTAGGVGMLASGAMLTFGAGETVAGIAATPAAGAGLPIAAAGVATMGAGLAVGGGSATLMQQGLDNMFPAHPEPPSPPGLAPPQDAVSLNQAMRQFLRDAPPSAGAPATTALPTVAAPVVPASTVPYLGGAQVHVGGGSPRQSARENPNWGEPGGMVPPGDGTGGTRFNLGFAELTGHPAQQDAPAGGDGFTRIPPVRPLPGFDAYPDASNPTILADPPVPNHQRPPPHTGNTDEPRVSLGGWTEGFDQAEQQGPQILESQGDPSLTRPTGPVNGVPVGQRSVGRIRRPGEPRAAVKAKAQVDSENQVADAAAAAGYQTVQKPTEGVNPAVTPAQLVAEGLRPRADPDLLLDSRIWDTYTPDKDSAGSVRDGIQRKIDDQQTHRVLVDLRGVKQTIESVRAAIRTNPLRGVKEIMFYTKDGLSPPFRP